MTDNSEKVLAMIAANGDRALMAMGLEAVGSVKSQFYKYPKAPYRTGDLYRSISAAKSSDTTIDIGTNIEYATFVHEGTSKMDGRPFIKDGIMGNEERIKKVGAAYLKQGFV